MSRPLSEEPRYAELFEFAPVGYMTFDGEGTIRGVNLVAAQMLGRERAELIGQRAFRNHVSQCLAQNMKATTELELSSTTLRIDSTPFADPDGVVFGCGTVLIDVSERRRSEAALSFSTKVGAALAVSLDYETTLEHVAELAVPELADSCIVESFTAKGEPRCVLAEAHSVPAKRDDVLCQLCLPLTLGERRFGTLILRNVTARRPFDETQRRLALDFVGRVAIALENARLYDVARDLRTPLNTLMLLATVLREDGVRRKRSEMMDRALARMHHLIRDL